MHVIRPLILVLTILTSINAQEIADQPSLEDITQLPPEQKPAAPKAAPTAITPPVSTTTPSPTKIQPAKLTPAMITQVWATPDGKPVKKTDANRYDLPVACQLSSLFMVNSNTVSQVQDLFKDYPSSQAFFPTNGRLASSFGSLIADIKKDPYFFLFLKRAHAIVLQELYAYLKKIYATFDLTLIGSLEEFIQAETKYTLNSKKLIMHHLMNIVDGQSYQFTRSLFPQLDKAIATQVGSTIIKNDRGVDLTWLILTDQQINEITKDSQQKGVLKSWQKKYLQLLKRYFNFFKEYTSEIMVLQGDNALLGRNNLILHAETIRALIKRQVDLRRPINPQFFFPSKGTIRGLTMIPALIKTIPVTTQSIPWPPQIVDAAQKGTRAKNNVTGASLPFPLAYFKDAKGAETTSPTGAKGLYMNMVSGASIFEQELLRQPAWLNTTEGIITMIRGALGDFSVLVGMGVIDPETEKVITAALFS